METKIKLLENERARMEKDLTERVMKAKEEKDQRAAGVKIKTLLVEMFTTVDFAVPY